MHHRRAIREAVQALLVNAATMAGANVFTSRSRPILQILQKKESVASVYTSDETVRRSADGSLYERSLSISVEVATGGGDELDDKLDAFCLEVEAALAADPTLGLLLASEMVMSSTTSEVAAGGNMMVGAARMDFDAVYYTDAPAADVPAEFPVPDDFYPGAVGLSVAARPVSDGYAAADPIANASALEAPDSPQSPSAPLPGATGAEWWPSPSACGALEDERE
jgi:hypothetical protein